MHVDSQYIEKGATRRLTADSEAQIWTARHDDLKRYFEEDNSIQGKAGQSRSHSLIHNLYYTSELQKISVIYLLQRTQNMGLNATDDCEV